MGTPHLKRKKRRLKNKKIVFITGATGFVGANLVRQLIADDYQVHCLVRSTKPHWRLKEIQSSLHLHKGNLENNSRLTKILKKIQPHWLFHLATYGAYSHQTDYDQMIKTNILGAINLFEAAIKSGVNVFINTGSSSEYGYKNHAPKESEKANPNSAYALTKLKSTEYLHEAAAKHKINLITLRLYSVYGPYEEPSRLIPKIVINGIKGKWPPLVQPNISRDFIYVNDVVDAYLHAAKKGKRASGNIFNVGTGQQSTIRNVVQIAGKALKIKQIPKWGTMPNRRWDTTTWVANNKKIKRILKWRSNINLTKGFTHTKDWFLENPSQIKFYSRFVIKR